MNIGATRHKEERDEQISTRIRYQDLAARAPMPVEDEDYQQVVIHPVPSADRHCDSCDETIDFEISVHGITQAQTCRTHVGDVAGSLATREA